MVRTRRPLAYTRVQYCIQCVCVCVCRHSHSTRIRYIMYYRRTRHNRNGMVSSGGGVVGGRAVGCTNGIHTSGVPPRPPWLRFAATGSLARWAGVTFAALERKGAPLCVNARCTRARACVRVQNPNNSITARARRPAPLTATAARR